MKAPLRVGVLQGATELVSHGLRPRPRRSLCSNTCLLDRHSDLVQREPCGEDLASAPRPLEVRGHDRRQPKAGEGRGGFGSLPLASRRERGVRLALPALFRVPGRLGVANEQHACHDVV